MGDKVVGLYPMTADVLHTGHLIAIEIAKHNCDYLIVALNCTPNNKKPVQSIYERFMQLKAVKYIDEIIPYQGRDDLELLASSLPYDIRFLGEEYMGEDWDGKEEEERLEKEIMFLTRQHRMSRSNLKERIKRYI